MSEISDYIVPLYLAENEKMFIGTGFIVGNMLITAGHVPNKGKSVFYKYRHQYFKRDAILDLIHCERPKDDVSGQVPDIAIYYCPKMESPLEMAMDLPFEAEDYTNICWQKTQYGVWQITSQCIIRSSAVGTPNGIGFDFMSTNRLNHGSSGSPLLLGNKVYGMLVVGTEKFKLTPEGYALLKEQVSQEEIEQFIKMNHHTCIAVNAHFIQDRIAKARKKIWLTRFMHYCLNKD